VPEGEPIVGVIAGLQRRKGLLGYETFNVVVTPGRLVFALMTQQMMNDAVRQAQQEAKSQGKGLLGQMAAQMGWLSIMSERYHATPVEQALTERPENFFIPNNQIRKVKVERREDRQRHTHSDHVIFEATSGKYEFELKGANPGDVRQLLGQVLGAAVR
jgi:quercetin dioxygenase-like cupin family protein